MPEDHNLFCPLHPMYYVENVRTGRRAGGGDEFPHSYAVYVAQCLNGAFGGDWRLFEIARHVNQFTGFTRVLLASNPNAE